jgi:hypothetical protein
MCVKRREQQQDRNDMNRILRARNNRKTTVTSLARCLVGRRVLPMLCNSARLARSKLSTFGSASCSSEIGSGPNLETSAV